MDKKIRGRIHYFGPADDWQAAIDEYEHTRDYINLDIGRLNRSGIQGGFINIPIRMKTGMARRSRLWSQASVENTRAHGASTVFS